MSLVSKLPDMQTRCDGAKHHSLAQLSGHARNKLGSAVWE